jgi:hypothetical protein
MKNLRQSFVACSTPFLHRIIVGPAAQAGVSHGDRAPLGFVFRRLLDMVHNDASGVSALQHCFKRRWLPSALRFAPALANPMRPMRRASVRCSGARSERSAIILIPVSGSAPRLMRDCLVSARSLARYASISDGERDQGRPALSTAMPEFDPAALHPGMTPRSRVMTRLFMLSSCA